MKFTTITELLSSPDRFTTRAYARDENGREVNTGDRKAVAWCLLGAVEAVYADSPETQEKVINAMQAALPHPYSSMFCGIELFNDQSSYEDILKFVSHLGI